MCKQIILFKFIEKLHIRSTNTIIELTIDENQLAENVKWLDGLSLFVFAVGVLKQTCASIVGISSPSKPQVVIASVNLHWPNREYKNKIADEHEESLRSTRTSGRIMRLARKQTKRIEGRAHMWEIRYATKPSHAGS